MTYKSLGRVLDDLADATGRRPEDIALDAVRDLLRRLGE